MVKKELYRIVLWQLVVIIGIALTLTMIQGLKAGYSVFLGGLAYWLPTLFFIWRVSRHAGAHAARRFVISFMVGEAAKLFFSGILFVLIIKYVPINLMDVLIGFIIAIAAFWVAAIFSLFKQGAKS